MDKSIIITILTHHLHLYFKENRLIDTDSEDFKKLQEAIKQVKIEALNYISKAQIHILSDLARAELDRRRES